MKDDQTKEKFIELRGLGHSYERIANELKISKTTLISWSRALSAEIENSRHIQREALFERLHVSAEKRIELLSIMLTKVQVEIESRDLTEVPTAKLYELASKLCDTLNNINTPLALKGEKDLMEVAFTKEVSWTA